ncbi:recombinase family protein [Streptomyces mirabilis]|uniref:recombinase family protein n=1 Tax=Streptomyces mirabilis TaxID=68239 RepID=UPI0036C5E0D1
MNRPVAEGEWVFSRHAGAELSAAYDVLVPQCWVRIWAGQRQQVQEGAQGEHGGDLREGVSQRQKKDQTIASQTAALRAYADRMRLELPEEWVFEDEGHSGATLMRPALERLRDLVAQVGVDVVVVYAPDRLARKFAYQALLIEEFARVGTRVEFIRGPRGDSPEEQLLVQSRACSPSTKRPS